MNPDIIKEYKLSLIQQIKDLIKPKLEPSRFRKADNTGFNSKPLLVWPFLDNDGELVWYDYNENTFVLKSFLGFTEDGCITELHMGLSYTSFENLPIEDLILVLNTTKEILNKK